MVLSHAAVTASGAVWVSDGMITTRTYASPAQVALERAVFGDDQPSGSHSWDAAECSVLLSGLAGEVSSALSRRLTLDGVARERILFCDF